jgi:hypothetical protein
MDLKNLFDGLIMSFNQAILLYDAVMYIQKKKRECFVFCARRTAFDGSEFMLRQ